MRRLLVVGAVLCFAAGVLAETATRPGGPEGGVVGGAGTRRASATQAVMWPMRIVYLVDRSDFSAESIVPLVKEVERAVGGLSPVQRFGLIVCDEGEESAEILTEGAAPVYATPEIRREAIAKLGNVPRKGLQVEPVVPLLDGFQKAFAMKPDLVFFVTQGRFEPRLIEQVRKLNSGKSKVPIYTIAFMGRDDGYFDQLRQIAKDSGGWFKYVARKDAEGPPAGAAARTRPATAPSSQPAASHAATVDRMPDLLGWVPPPMDVRRIMPAQLTGAHHPRYTLRRWPTFDHEHDHPIIQHGVNNAIVAHAYTVGIMARKLYRTHATRGGSDGSHRRQYSGLGTTIQFADEAFGRLGVLHAVGHAYSPRERLREAWEMVGSLPAR